MDEVGAAFKTCSCGTVWRTREAFLSDPAVQIIGYSPHFRELELGWLHFNHHACRTTLAMQVDQYADLYSGPRFADRRTGSADCPGYCLREDELRACPQQCECAWVRVVVGMVTIWPKTVEAGVV
jgi:hypothetical protein